jgi:hypothetical protein
MCLSDVKTVVYLPTLLADGISAKYKLDIKNYLK